MNLKTNARLLDLTLVLIGLLSAAALFLAHEDPFVKKVVCAYVRLCPVIPNAKAWRRIVYDLAIGSLTSLIFYALVVRLPDYQRRQRFKKSLTRHYSKRCRPITLRNAMKIGPPVVLHKGRHGDGSGVRIRGPAYGRSCRCSQSAH